MSPNREILARGKDCDATRLLLELAFAENAILEGRVAAIFTLKQLEGADSQSSLLKLVDLPPVREFELRPLTAHGTEVEGVDLKPFVYALTNPSPCVRAQALISLGRLNNPAAAPSILPLTVREHGSVMPAERPIQNPPDPGRVLPHIAVRALVQLQAIDACLEALEGPYADGALWEMRYMHDRRTVEGLIKRLSAARTPELQRGLLVTLIRLYNREADNDGSWWGIRPDNSGPYFDRTQWEMSERIGAVLTTAIKDSDEETVAYFKRELARHGVTLSGISMDAGLTNKESDVTIVVPRADPANPDQIGNMSLAAASARSLATSGDAVKGEAIFKSQSCIACHTTADGQTLKGPHLFEIGKRYKPAELVESVLKPSVKLAQGYESYRFVMVDRLVFQGFVVSERADATVIRESDGKRREIRKSEFEERLMLKLSAMPEGLAANLMPEQLSDLIAYLQSLK